jgi:hypothetical protein
MLVTSTQDITFLSPTSVSLYIEPRSWRTFNFDLLPSTEDGMYEELLKTEASNRKRGIGTREKVRSKRINLEGNTNAQEINVSQCPV